MTTPEDPPMPVQSMEEIMASIRRIVSDEPVVDPDMPATAPAPAAAAAPVPKLAGGDVTLETFLRSMLEPMLKTWLDANLPEIVEAATRAEIQRLTGQP